MYSVSTRDAVRLIPKCPRSSCEFLTISVLSDGRGTFLQLPSVSTLYKNPLTFLNPRTLLFIMSRFDCDAMSDMSPDTSRCMQNCSDHISGRPPYCAVGLAAASSTTLAILAITTTKIVYRYHTSADHATTAFVMSPSRAGSVINGGGHRVA